MGVKEVVRQMLDLGDTTGLEQLVSAEPGALHHLVGRLWDPDSTISRRAAAALGHGACAHPELGREVLRRLLWALNDESGMHGAAACVAVAEIGARAPEVASPFLAPFASCAGGKELRPEVLEALQHIVVERPELALEIAEVLKPMSGSIDDEDRVVYEQLVGPLREKDNHA